MSGSNHHHRRPSWKLVYCLGALVAAQWCLITFLVYDNHNRECPKTLAVVTTPKHAVESLSMATTASASRKRGSSGSHPDITLREPDEDEKPIGVAVTVLFRAPKWFHLRYTVMLNNVLAILPPGWKLQVFVNESWFKSQNVLNWHPGLRHLLYSSGKVTVTPLPDRLTAHGQPPKKVLVDEWFWSSVLADRVFTFSGNGALCGNHNTRAFELLAPRLDYVGAPDRGKAGGKGEFSFRNRTAMLEVIRYAAKTGQKLEGTESDFFLRLMQEMNDKQLANFSIGTKFDTYRLGSTTGLANDTHVTNIPLVASGTQAQLTYEERDTLLKHCPELKVIFPSLHEPACFGAHPQPEPCRQSICALGEIPSHGC